MNPLLSFIRRVCLPPRCLQCKKRTSTPHSLCSECWVPLNFIENPMCSLCSLPFEHQFEGEMICGECSKEVPPYKQARSVLVYDQASKPLIMRFKHGDRIDIAPLLVSWMVKAGKDLIKSSDLLVPVPLHWQRLFTRQYNQAAILVNGIARETGTPRCNTLLTRCRSTASQGKMSRQERAKNVHKAFTVSEKFKDMIKGRHIVLVDDVLTTGATLRACSKVLLKSQAGSVKVLTLARSCHGGT